MGNSDSKTKLLKVEQVNKRTVKEYCEKIICSKDTSCIDQYVIPNYVEHSPFINGDGVANLKEGLKGWFGVNYDEYFYDILHLISDHDLVFVHGKCLTQAGEVIVMVDIYRLADGKIVEHWDISQTLP